MIRVLNRVAGFITGVVMFVSHAHSQSEVIFNEIDGVVPIETEHFCHQYKNDLRKWVIRTPESGGNLSTIASTASQNAYIEVAPDTRVTHDHPLIKEENFSDIPGSLCIVDYKINILNPGRYYVWVRAFSTGSEDNGVHVGMDGNWPESGKRMQWCDGKGTWTWESKQRTEKDHCGEAKLIYLDIASAGQHTISFSMREDGFKMDKIVLSKAYEKPEGKGAEPVLYKGIMTALKPTEFASLTGGKQQDGNGTVSIGGELKQWHKISLDLRGPFACEKDIDPNPFTDYRMEVIFRHESGNPVYRIPGYFAADGNAGETSAESGNIWRAHLSPDKTGKWFYEVIFMKGSMVALTDVPWGKALKPYHGGKGEFEIITSDKIGHDFRSKGRLEYVGKHHLQFKGSKEYFLKAGPDAPETLLAYAGFDGTLAMKKNVPLKQYKAHEQDWKLGDPVWKENQGKGLIGALNYISGKGCNTISFLTYNAGGDGDNVWPFIDRNDKFHYDCSKLDQWQLVFDYAQKKGIHLHFKTQETENDDNTRDKMDRVPESLDGGELGPQRILYYRELIARFSYLLALNWNLGEENTQTTEQQQAMADYFAKNCPYRHNIVLHTYPNQQYKVYTPLVGNSELTGVSLQNEWNHVHKKTLHWLNASAKTNRPWVVANDEQGSASEGVPPDPGYKGWDAKTLNYDIHDVRKQTLWANLMAGGAGVEYYFGYKLPENDLVCEDFRSRDISWDFCNIALSFFRDHAIPFQEMTNRNELIGNSSHDSTKFCLAKEGEIYLIYLAYASSTEIDLTNQPGTFNVKWFNPVSGGKLQFGSLKKINGGKKVDLGNSPGKQHQDWLILVEKRKD